MLPARVELDPSTCQILRSRGAAAALVELLRRSYQGQLFELLARPDSREPYRAVATIAGSSLRSTTTQEWRSALSWLAGGTESTGTPAAIRLEAHDGRPVLWKTATAAGHFNSYPELQAQLGLLRPLAESYRQRTKELHRQLGETRTVEDWKKVSDARLAMVRNTLRAVVEWARTGVHDSGAEPPALAPTILLVGSSAGGLGLVSDVDLLPLWPSADGQGSTGRELIERIVTGLSACDLRADNLVARWSSHRLMGLSLSHWQAELATFRKEVDALNMVSGLLVVGAAPVVGDQNLARKFASDLADAAWAPPARWRRRWVRWWEDLRVGLSETPQRSAQATSFHLRQLTILREILDLLPRPAVPPAFGCDLASLRDRFAWFRDMAAMCPVPDAGGTEPRSPIPEEGWTEALVQLESLATDVFRAVALSRQRTRLERAVAGIASFLQRVRRPTAPPVLLHTGRAFQLSETGTAESSK